MLSLRKRKNNTVQAAADRWNDGQKFKTNQTSGIYKRAARRTQAWAEDEGIDNVSDASISSGQQVQNALG